MQQKPADHITLLIGSVPATKHLHLDGRTASPPAHGTYFQVAEIQLSDIHDLHRELASAATNRNVSAIRDRLKPDRDRAAPQRRLQTNFEAVPRHWVMLDFDGIEAWEGLDPAGLPAVAWLIQTRLPPAFHGSSYIVQFSSSAGTAKAGRKIKVHLWFWLQTAVTSAELKPWAAQIGADGALFHPVQVHYIADPIFIDGADPLAGRRILLVSGGRDDVAFTPPPVVRAAPGLATGALRPPVAVRQGRHTEDDGREDWLKTYLFREAKAVLEVGGALDVEAMTTDAWAVMNAEFPMLDRKWAREMVAGKVTSTVQRANAGQIVGLHSIKPKGTFAPHWPGVVQPIDLIRAELLSEIKGFIAHPEGVLVPAAPPGAGKTLAVVETITDAVASGDIKAVEIFVPTVALAVEVQAQLPPGSARVIRGRDQPDLAIPGQAMCPRRGVAAEVTKAGLGVQEYLCKGCHLRKTCGHQKQFRCLPPIRILTHAYLPLPRRSRAARAPRVPT